MFKRIVSSALIATQLGFVGIATAATPITPHTAEFNLLQNSIALAGQGLSQEELTARASDAFNAYDKTAEQDGRLERMEQALVDLHLYTPEQAHELTTDAQNAVSQMKVSDVQSADQALSDELGLLVSRYPSGAQFSGCDLGFPMMISGFFVGIAGGVVWSVGADSTCGPYGADCHNHPVVESGIIITAAAVLALIDGGIIMLLAPGQC